MDVIRSWKTFWDPPRFQGWGKRRSYFEGWYFKLVSQDGGYKMAVIPGIAYDPDGQGEAFIQVLDSTAQKSWFHRFPATAFDPESERFFLRLGDNQFSSSGIRLDLPELRGELHFEDTVPWKGNWKAPGIMGWYAYMPFMQCYHGLVSMDHRLTGSLMIRDREIAFDGGRGYIEKDWGSSFPKAWIWGQSNHFEGSPGTSLMFSVAHIPWLGNYFIGFLTAFYHEGETIVLATYTGARRSTTLTGDGVRLTLEDHRHRLEIEAEKAPGSDLLSPVTGSMTGKVNESLDARFRVRYFRDGKERLVTTAVHAGMELGGDDISILLTK